jgi:hypothetical protein
MAGNAIDFAVLLILTTAVAVGLYFAIRKSLRALLDSVVAVPACTTFYTRLLLVGFVLLALRSALDVSYNLKDDAAFMEHVWKVGEGLAKAFGTECLFLTGYLIIVTILVAVFRRKSD